MGIEKLRQVAPELEDCFEEDRLRVMVEEVSERKIVKPKIPGFLGHVAVHLLAHDLEPERILNVSISSSVSRRLASK